MINPITLKPLLRYYPDPILRMPCKEITDEYEAKDITSKLRLFLQFLNKDSHQAIGVAAPQIGISSKAFATQIELGQKPKVYLNPTIWETEGFGMISTEGCLSIPNVFVDVKRYRKITLHFMALNGSLATETFTGIEAVCVQHELDHLNGKLIIDA